MGSARQLAGLASVVLVAVLGIVALLPECASACSCAMSPGSRQEAAKQALSDSTAVFTGEVADIDRPFLALGSGAPMTVTFRVSKSWKGSQRGMLEVKTPVSGASCGYPFRSGERYLVYASGASIVEEEGLEVVLCGETKPLSEAGADLEALGDGQTPKDGGALSNTSGGVPVRTMAGLAGLAIAAAVLLMFRRRRTR